MKQPRRRPVIPALSSRGAPATRVLGGGKADAALFPLPDSSSLTALELDDHIAESHVALGNAIAYLGYDWKRGKHEDRRALQIHPLSAEALHRLAHVLEATGRHGEWVETMRRALDLEPVSSIFNSCFGQVLYAARRYDDAVRHCGTAIELEPGNPHPYTWLGMVHVQRGDDAAAERAFRQGLAVRAFTPRIHGARVTRVRSGVTAQAPSSTSNGSDFSRETGQLTRVSRRGSTRVSEIAIGRSHDSRTRTREAQRGWSSLDSTPFSTSSATTRGTASSSRT